MKYQRLVPLIVPLLIWFLNQIFLREPDLFYVALALGALLITLSVKYLLPKEPVFWLPYIIPPLLFFISFSFYSAIIVGLFWLQLCSLLIFWFLFSYLRALYYYFAAPDKRPLWAAKVDNLLLSGGFLTAYAAAAILFDLPAFFNWSLLALLATVVVLSGLLLFQFYLFPKEGASLAKYLSLLSVLVLTELTGIFALLPLNFHILALFFAISYYLCLTIIRLASNGILNRRALKWPLILGGIIITVLLLTSRWL